MKNTLVKQSKIQGTGVFATKNFRAGQEILAFDDSHVVEDESMLNQEDLEYNADFFDGKIVIMQEPERSINHSCDPNSYVKTIRGIRKLFAMKDIAEDQEITCDYTINGDNEGTFPCACGANRCRKIYNGNYFKLPLELQIEYLPYLDDWFVQHYRDKFDSLMSNRETG